MRAGLGGVFRCPSWPLAPQHLAESTQQGPQALPALQSECQNWPWMGRPPLSAVLQLGEGEEMRGRSSLQTLESFWLLGRGQILKTQCSQVKNSFPGRMGRDLPLPRGSGAADSQTLTLAGIFLSEEDFGTEPRWTTWTLGRDGAFLCTLPGPSLTWRDKPPPRPAVFPKRISSGQERLPSPKVFIDTWQRASDSSRCLLPKLMSP